MEIIPLFVVAGTGLWFFVKKIEQTRHRTHTRDLESKIRSAQGEALHLKEQIHTLKGEVISLQKTLSQERLSNKTTVSAMTESFRRGLISTGLITFALAFLAGGGMFWKAAHWKMEAAYLQSQAQTKTENQLNALKVELYEKQMLRMEKDLEIFRKAWFEQQVAKTVAQTKLEIIMNSLSAKKDVEGFRLNYKKMKHGLQDKAQDVLKPEDLLLLKQINR